MNTFLERFFNKTDSSSITYSDFENFLQSEIEENLNLDYKSGWLIIGRQRSTIVNNKLDNNKSDKGFSDLARTVVGFANAEGGLLILGVQELPEVINGVRTKVRPGSVEPLPLGIVTKEMIESKLRALIQFPLDDLRILPLRLPNNHEFVCLIDIPPSVRAPHQLSSDKVYYQRRNFFTEAMEHYQISDLFGKRLAPSLEVAFTATIRPADKSILVTGTISNLGRMIAKYPMCIITIQSEQYKFAITGSPAGWNNVNEKTAQFTPGGRDVVYPSIGLGLRLLQIAALSPEAYGSTLILTCLFCAEGTQPKLYTFLLSPPTGNDLPNEIQQTFLLVQKQPYIS